MKNPVELIIPFAGGLLLSGAYFSTLWFTVRRIPHAHYPFALVGLSFLFRTAGLLGGFYLLTQGRLERLVACLVGYLIVRTLCVACMKTSMTRTSSAQGA